MAVPHTKKSHQGLLHAGGEEERVRRPAIHIKKAHQGLLHQDLGVKQGETIPMSKIAAALHSKNPAIRKRANFARNAKQWAR